MALCNYVYFPETGLNGGTDPLKLPSSLRETQDAPIRLMMLD